MSASIATLYAEELKATMRGRFAWLGAGVVLLLLGALSTLSTQGGWLQGYCIIAYGLVPLAFVPIAAAMLASPRANRFVESVFTAPVSRSHWLIAKLLVLLTLAAAYYLALLPSMFVYAAHIGVPLLLHKYLLWTPGILLASIAVGLLIGVLFIGRSVTAPIGAAMGILLAYVVFIPLQEFMAATGNGASRMGHITLISPAVLLKNALGFSFSTRTVLSETRMTWTSLVVIVAGSLLLAAWAFLRAQGVETWEATRAQRWAIAGAILAFGLFPAIFAETAYDAPAPALNNAPNVRLGGRQAIGAALVAQGMPFPRRWGGPVLTWDSGPLTVDQNSRRDLLLALPLDASQKVTELHATIEGGDGLEAAADSSALNQPAPPLETRAYRNDNGPEMPDGHHLTSGWVIRIPITLDPHNPWDIYARYPLNIDAAYNVSGDPTPHAFELHAGVDARIGRVMAQMALASLILPLFCFGAAFTRWRRTR